MEVSVHVCEVGWFRKSEAYQIRYFAKKRRDLSGSGSFPSKDNPFTDNKY
jgi:uncharacterized protein YkuJ